MTFAFPGAKKPVSACVSARTRFFLSLMILTMLAGCFCDGRAMAQQQALTSAQFTADFDTMWTGLRDNYAYFDKKQTDWNKVREIYRPQFADVKRRSDFVRLAERVLAELYDDHASLSTNLDTSPRLVPTGADIWAEWIGGRAIITELRPHFSAEQAGLKTGMEIISINGLPIREAVSRRLPQSLRAVSEDADNQALRVTLAGTHDRPRVIAAKNRRGATIVYPLDLPAQTTVDSVKHTPKVEWSLLPQQIGYIKINDLSSADIPAQFDAALEGVRTTRGLILDLRDIPQGGGTDVAEPILGRFITRRAGYQQVVPLHAPAYIREVSPTGAWTYKAPVVVLADHWTGSMAEGMAVGLDGMKRGVVVGTRLAGLNGGIFSLELPDTKIRVNYAGEKLNQLDGTPRENFAPPVLVDLVGAKSGRSQDAILEAGISKLNTLLKRQSDRTAEHVER